MPKKSPIPRASLAILLHIAILAAACDNATEPFTMPAVGSYELIAATASEPTDTAWALLPFEYAITRDSSCVFRLLGGTIDIDARTYSAVLDQEVVSCEEGPEPMALESGRLAPVYQGRGFNGSFAFIADSANRGWLELARPRGNEFLVKLVAPIDSSYVHWLRFRRVNEPRLDG